MNILIVSHCLGGLDGVSQIAASWSSKLEIMGHLVTEAAGTFFSSRPRPHHVVQGLWAPTPGATAPPVNEEKIFALVSQHDFIIVENIFTLPANPLAALCFYEAITSCQKPSIIHHHDFHWEDSRRAHHKEFPLLPPDAIHVTISQKAQQKLEKHKGVKAHVVYNSLNLTALSMGKGAELREEKGISKEDFLVLHPSRIYPRKNIPRAIDFCNRLEDYMHNPVTYWLTGSESETDVTSLTSNAVHGVISAIEDGYAAADLVVMSSDWEGWGRPVIEAAAAGVPIASSRYPILDEIESFGIKTYSLDDLSWVSSIGSQQWEEQILANQNSVARIYDRSTRLEDIFQLAGLK